MPRHNPRDDIVLQRLARYSEWVPYKDAMKTTNSIPQQAMLMMSSEKVMPIMSLAGREGRGKVAPVKGAPGLTITLAECPAGDRAGPHKHTASVENFFCVQSRFQNHLGGTRGSSRLSWNRWILYRCPRGCIVTLRMWVMGSGACS